MLRLPRSLVNIRFLALLALLSVEFAAAADSQILTLNFYEKRRQGVEKKKEPFYGTTTGGVQTYVTKSELKVVAHIPGLDHTKFTDATRFSVNLLDSTSGRTFDLTVDLGDNRKYKPGATKVKIRRHAGKATHVDLLFSGETVTFLYKGHFPFLSPIYLNHTDKPINRPNGPGTDQGSALTTISFAGTTIPAVLPFSVTYRNWQKSVGDLNSKYFWCGKVELMASQAPQ